VKLFLQRHLLGAFFVLAFALSWYPWIIALFRGHTTGPNPLGPLLAGLIVTAIVSGRSGLREYLGRIVHCRVGVHYLATACLLPILICLISVALTVCLTGDPKMGSLSIENLRELPERFLFTFLFVGLGEEPGWRGFALPQLQTRHSPLIASLILAPIWMIWHLPLMGTEFPWLIVPPFLLSVLGGTFLLTWIFNRTGGSVFVAMLFHAATNTIGAGLLFPLFSGSALLLLWWIYGAACVVAGLAVLLHDERRQISRLSARTFAAGVTAKVVSVPLRPR